MNIKMIELIAKVICDVKSDYGCILKTQDYIYLVYGRVLDKIADQDLSFKELNEIADMVRSGVKQIEKENY